MWVKLSSWRAINTDLVAMFHYHPYCVSDDDDKVSMNEYCDLLMISSGGWRVVTFNNPKDIEILKSIFSDVSKL